MDHLRPPGADRPRHRAGQRRPAWPTWLGDRPHPLFGRSTGRVNPSTGQTGQSILRRARVSGSIGVIKRKVGHESDSPTKAKISRWAGGAARSACRAAIFFRGPCSVVQFWPRPCSPANSARAASRPAAGWVPRSTGSPSDSHQPPASTARREPLCPATVLTLSRPWRVVHVPSTRSSAWSTRLAAPGPTRAVQLGPDLVPAAATRQGETPGSGDALRFPR